jgi:hypothetical protein
MIVSMFQTWAFLIAFTTALVSVPPGNAVDLSKPHPAQGPLKVLLDYNLAINSGAGPKQLGSGSKRTVLYSNVLQFQENVNTISSAQLVKIATDAYKEMAQLDSLYRFKDALPNVMSLLAIDNFIILASSQKGSTSFGMDLPESPVARTLARCQIAFERDTGKNVNHRMNSRCGEIMAAHIYFRMMDSMPGATMKGKSARIVAVERKPDGDSYEYKIKAPCGTGEQVSQLLIS